MRMAAGSVRTDTRNGGRIIVSFSTSYRGGNRLTVALLILPGPDTGIVNFYQTRDTLMGHVDRSELDPYRPLISIS